jgi:hypothetical protein
VVEPGVTVHRPAPRGADEAAELHARPREPDAGRDGGRRQVGHERDADAGGHERELCEQVGLRIEDSMVTLVEVPKENWSFGLGEAQYA